MTEEQQGYPESSSWLKEELLVSSFVFEIVGFANSSPCMLLQTM